MKILIVGGGGREHALAWKLRQSPGVREIFASPGNPGIAQSATCLPTPDSVTGYADMAESLGADLTVVGPEAPLVAGLADQLIARRLPVIGPTQAAARLEGSKIFAKKFFERAGIPTARSIQVTSEHQALYSLKSFSMPVVIKADGLAAGKGVTVATSRAEAEKAITRLGPHLVIEEFLVGEEVSFIGLSNGDRLVPFAPAQDHKQVFDGDRGPNTGGMGAYVDPRILTNEQTGAIMDRIIEPTLQQMARDGTPFRGFLFAGLMMTADGPKILEYNVRMGDPETQAILHAYRGDLAALFAGEGHAAESGCSICITLAAKDYPDPPRTGDKITGIEEAQATGATVFHAGTKNDDHNLVTSGGRVLGVTASGETLREAIANAYQAAEKIHFDGMHYRKDIGQKGLRRW